MVLTPRGRIVDIRNIDMFDNNKIAVICNAYVYFIYLPASKVKQTKKWINTDLFTKDKTYILGCMVQNMHGVFPHHFLRTRIVFSQSKLREDKYMS